MCPRPVAGLIACNADHELACPQGRASERELEGRVAAAEEATGRLEGELAAARQRAAQLEGQLRARGRDVERAGKALEAAKVWANCIRVSECRRASQGPEPKVCSKRALSTLLVFVEVPPSALA